MTSRTKVLAKLKKEQGIKKAMNYWIAFTTVYKERFKDEMKYFTTVSKTQHLSYLFPNYQQGLSEFKSLPDDESLLQATKDYLAIHITEFVFSKKLDKVDMKWMFKDNFDLLKNDLSEEVQQSKEFKHWFDSVYDDFITNIYKPVTDRKSQDEEDEKTREFYESYDVRIDIEKQITSFLKKLTIPDTFPSVKRKERAKKIKVKEEQEEGGKKKSKKSKTE